MGRKGKMVDYVIQSRYLNEAIQLRIYYPEKYSDLYKYHLCIMQDGNDYYQLGRVATLSDQLHERGEIENTIFVGIHYQNRYDRKKKYHPNGEQNKEYSKFLLDEVVPFLDETLPTLHMGQARTLMGDSLAGTLALMIALKYPNTFSNVIMQSPLVNETVLHAVKNTENIHAVDIYHTIGTNEEHVDTLDASDLDFLTPNRQLKELLEQKGLTYYYYELVGGEHTWKYWQKDLPNALTTMFN